MRQIEERKRKIIDLEQKNEELENEKRNFVFEKNELIEKLNSEEEKQIIQQ